MPVRLYVSSPKALGFDCIWHQSLR